MSKMIQKKTLFLFLFCLVSTFVNAQKVFDLPIWPQGAPTKSVDRDARANLRVYLPADRVLTGRAVVIFPGGAYKQLNDNHEGTQWAEFYNHLGIAAIVVNYRLPAGKEEVPMEDAEEAMRIVKRNAASWKIRSNDVGVMGFGVGGHLAAMLSTTGSKAAKPDFQILFYPLITMMAEYTFQEAHDNFFGKHSGKKQERNYSPDQKVTRVTPRALIILCDDDPVVQPANGINYYTELYRNDVPASIHIYPKGGHGWGSNMGFEYHLEMIMELKAWLKSF